MREKYSFICCHWIYGHSTLGVSKSCKTLGKPWVLHDFETHRKYCNMKGYFCLLHVCLSIWYSSICSSVVTSLCMMYLYVEFWLSLDTSILLSGKKLLHILVICLMCMRLGMLIWWETMLGKSQGHIQDNTHYSDCSIEFAYAYVCNTKIERRIIYEGEIWFLNYYNTMILTIFFQGPLVKWLKVNFGECFSAWVHVKALRVFVESVLR